MVNTPQITMNATTFLVNVGWFTTKARKTVTILVNDTSASYNIIICRYSTTRARGISHRHDVLCGVCAHERDDEICRSSLHRSPKLPITQKTHNGRNSVAAVASSAPPLAVALPANVSTIVTLSS